MLFSHYLHRLLVLCLVIFICLAKSDVHMLQEFFNVFDEMIHNVNRLCDYKARMSCLDQAQMLKSLVDFLVFNLPFF